MRVLVIGANGFVGRGVSKVLQQEHEVFEAGREYEGKQHVDLQDPESIASLLKDVKPDAVVNCAGIVENNEKAASNPVFTRNLLEQIAASGLPVQRIIALGSAGEYGIVDKLPVSEDAPRNATSPYGVSKVQEVDVAFEFREKNNLPVVVARLFNPIGEGMPPRTLIPGVLRQIEAFRAGETDRIEVGRLDAKRDFIDVSDVGHAISALLDGEPKHVVYNVGSGVATTIRELVEAILAESGLQEQPRLVEASDTPEPLFAVQADISCLREEFNWEPKKAVVDTLKDIMAASRPR